MMTLMPVAAFAAESTTKALSVVAVDNDTLKITFDQVISEDTGFEGWGAIKVYDEDGNLVANGATGGAGVAAKTYEFDLDNALTDAKTTVKYVPTAANYLNGIDGYAIGEFSLPLNIVSPVVDKTSVNATNNTDFVIDFKQPIAGTADDSHFKLNGTALDITTNTSVTMGPTSLTFSLDDSETLNLGINTIKYVGTVLTDSTGIAEVQEFEVKVYYRPAATGADADTSRIYTVNDNPTLSLDNEGLAETKITYTLKNAANALESEQVYIWFTEAGSQVGSTAVLAISGAETAKTTGTGSALSGAGDEEIPGLFVTTTPDNNDTLTVTFGRPGVYTLHAATVTDFERADISDNATLSEVYEDLNGIVTVSTNNKVTVKGQSTSSADYVMTCVAGDINTASATDAGVFAGRVNVLADNVANDTLRFEVRDANNDLVIGETVKIETNSSNIELSKASAVTNALGQFSFDVAGVREGDYKIYLTCGSYDATINVTVGATDPAYISLVNAPQTPIDVDFAHLMGKVQFAITDINGNFVSATTAATTQNAFGDPTVAANTNYVAIVSQPSESELSNEDVCLVPDSDANGLTGYATLMFKKDVVAEGDYEFKVVLDNGNYETVKITVKEFKTPVRLMLVYKAPSVELGGDVTVKTATSAMWMDANGVTKDATGVTLAATGYAIQNFDAATGKITAKSDEKYLGSEIVVTAVDSRYDLVTTATIKVVDAAAGLAFSANTGEVDVNNKYTVSVVDSHGNKVALDAAGSAVDASYVVLEKPADAKVSVTTSGSLNKLFTEGTFKMNLTSNKVGNVKVQVVVRIVERAADDSNQNVTKYYTGVETFAIGTGEIGKSVVMSIGSNELIVGSEVSKMDAKPMVQNSRTYVPFRALAEAFGATVAYDQATSSVTAELNGVKVVMTVGSPVYTVNGVEKTADVAPFVSDSRTFVPVRFAAEAFGIKVVPTYNEDGSVADVLFNM